MCSQIRTHVQKERDDKNHFKAELFRYIYVVIFGKHLSELYWIVLMSLYVLNALLAGGTS